LRQGEERSATVTNYFDQLVSEPRVRRPLRAYPTLAMTLIVLAGFIGAGVFLDSQHNVAVTGSVICGKSTASCPTTPGQGHSPSGGSGSGSTPAGGSGGSVNAAGQSGGGDLGAQNPSASGDSSGSGGKSGSLALTGTEIALLVVVALGLLVAGILLYRLSKKKASTP
jgi:hypothetical protein